MFAIVCVINQDNLIIEFNVWSTKLKDIQTKASVHLWPNVVVPDISMVKGENMSIYLMHIQPATILPIENTPSNSNTQTVVVGLL